MNIGVMGNFFLCAALSVSITGNSPKDVPYISRYVKSYTSEQKTQALAKIKESPVMADVILNAVVYEDKNMQFPTADLSAGVSVEILEDFSMEQYKIIENLTGIKGWVDAKCLHIPPDTPSDKSVVSPEQMDIFVNIKGYASPTKYLIFTDLGRQTVYIFKGQQYRWEMIKSFSCSSGKNESPTTRGTYKIVDRGEWFFSPRLNSGAMYWLRFNGAYLFHSIPMDNDQHIIQEENFVGEKRSSGCVRLKINDVKWIYDNITDKTTVIIM